MAASQSMQPLQDVHVRGTVPLVSPRYLKQEENVTDAAAAAVSSMDVKRSKRSFLAKIHA